MLKLDPNADIQQDTTSRAQEFLSRGSRPQQDLHNRSAFNRDFVALDATLSSIFYGSDGATYCNLRLLESGAPSAPIGRAFFEARLETADGRTYITIRGGENQEVFFKEQVENDPEKITEKLEDLLHRARLASQGLKNIPGSEEFWKDFLIDKGFNPELASLWATRLTNCLVRLGPDLQPQVVTSPEDFDKLATPIVGLNFVDDLVAARGWLSKLGISESELAEGKTREFTFDDGSRIVILREGERLLVGVFPSRLTTASSSESFKLVGATFPLARDSSYEVQEINGVKVLKPTNSNLTEEEIREIVDRVQRVASRIEQDTGRRILEEIVLGGENVGDSASGNGRTMFISDSTINGLLARAEGADLVLAHEVAHLVEYRLRGICIDNSQTAFNEIWQNAPQLFLSLVADNFLSPVLFTEVIEQHFKGREYVLGGHPRSNPRELFASILNSLYSSEAEASLLEMKNSNLSIREWALRNIVPLLEHKRSLAERGGLEAMAFTEEYSRLIDYFRNSNDPVLDQPVQNLVEFYKQALFAMKKDLNENMPNSGSSSGLVARIDRLLELLQR